LNYLPKIILIIGVGRAISGTQRMYRL